MKNILFALIFIFLSEISFAQITLSKPVIKDSLNFCGDNQVVTSGKHLFKPLRVLVTENEKPVAGVAVEMRVVLSPDLKNQGIIAPSIVATNNNGIAQFNYVTGTDAGDYLLAALLPDNTNNSGILVYKVTVRNNYWALMVIIGLLGGPGLFLFGINYLTGIFTAFYYPQIQILPYNVQPV